MWDTSGKMHSHLLRAALSYKKSLFENFVVYKSKNRRDPRKCIRIFFVRCPFPMQSQRPAGKASQARPHRSLATEEARGLPAESESIFAHSKL